jgi:hypothetical protein
MAVVFFVLIASQRAVEALCVVGSLDDLLPRSEVVVIFSGTVQDLQTVPAGQIVTFDTDRFWKGEPGQHIVIYNRQEAGAAEQLTLSQGVRYLVWAYRQSPVDREQFQLPPADAERLATNFCTVTRLQPESHERRYQNLSANAVRTGGYPCADIL